MFGYGYGFAYSITSGNGGSWNWTSANAEAYWNALISESFDATIYGIEEEDFMIFLDDMFVSLNTAGVLTKIKRWTPRLGTTSATQSINAVNIGVFDGVFASGTTFDTDGVIFDGVTGYEDTGFDQLDFTAANNFGMSWKNVISGTDAKYIMGNNNTSGQFVSIFTAFGNKYFYNLATASWVFNDFRVDGKFYTVGHDGDSFDLYEDGVNIETLGSGGGSFQGGENLYIGCVNIGGVASDFASCKLRNEIFHDGLSAAESLALFTALDTFDTLIGR